MVRRAFGVSSLALLAAMGASPASAAPWSRGYVVGFYEFAFRYGGRADYTRGAEIEPGVDCPHGSTLSFSNPTQTVNAVKNVAWHTKEEIDTVANAQNRDRSAPGGGLGYFQVWSRNSAFRGYKREIETYVNPFAADDPGQPEVQSKVAEGFNLDGKVSPSNFVSPDGEEGIDNNLYRAWGCDAPWRGNGNGVLVLRSNDKMLEGLFTVVIRVSGNKDPMNDDAATMEIGYSPDKIMKDARGNTGQDYSFRILKGPQYTRLKAKVKDGVIETEQADIHMPQIAWFAGQLRDANFHQGKIRLVPNADGTANALLGGYRDWRDLYAQNVYGQDGGQQGVREHEDMVALYFALRRNADGLYNAKTGRYDGISTAYRLKLAQAYVVDPATPMGIPPVAEGDKLRVVAYDQTYAAMAKGALTLVPQPVPHVSNEPCSIDGGQGGRRGQRGPGAAKGTCNVISAQGRGAGQQVQP